MLIFRSKNVSKSTALTTHALSNQHKDALLLEKAKITMCDSSKKTINNGNKHIINIYWMAKKIYSNFQTSRSYLYLKTYRNSALNSIF